MEVGSMLAAGSFGLLLLLVLSVSASWWRTKARKLNLPPGPPPRPIIGNLHQLGKILHQSLFRMAKQYGPIMSIRLGSVPVVIASSADAARQFLQVHDRIFSHRPRMAATKIFGYGSAPVSVTYALNNRADLKKIMTMHLLSAKRVEETRPVRAEEEALLVKAVMEDSEQNHLVNLHDRVCKCIANIAIRLVINRRLSDHEIGKFPGMAEQLTGFLGTFLLEDYIPYLAIFDVRGTKRRMYDLQKQLDEFLEKVMATYRREKNVHPMPPAGTDILDVLLSLSSPGLGTKEFAGLINDTVIKGMILDLFVAGFRTSTVTVHWAMAELLRHPAIMQKLQQELDEVVGRDRLVAETDLQNLPYLQAVVKETFRLHPPAPLMLPHESSESCKINGYDIPKKTRVFVNVWAIGRDPSSWEDPLQFDPQRFIRNSHVDVRGQDFALIPFGSGRRACPGVNSGLVNVQYTLATLLHSFDWDLPNGQLPGDVDMTEAGGLGLIKSTPVLAMASPRLPKHVYHY